MARLGHGRRERARLSRAPSVTTPTPLVRKRVFVELDTRPHQHRGVRGRGRRIKATILRGLQYAPTPTPLVRNRVFVEPDRRPLVTRLGRGRRIRAKILRGVSTPTPTPLVPPHVIYADRAGWRTKVARRLRHQPVVKRAPSVPTPTPLVRKRVLISQQTRTVEWARIGRGRRLGARIVRPKPYLTIFGRQAQPAVERRPRGPLVHRFLRHPARILRAPSVPTATPLVRKRVTVEPRATKGRRRFRPVILRSRVAAQRIAQPLVRESRRRRRRYQRPILIRSRVAAAQRVVQPLIRGSRRQGRKRHKLLMLRAGQTISRPRATITRPRSRVRYVIAASRARVVILRAPGVFASVTHQYGYVTVTDLGKATVTLTDLAKASATLTDVERATVTLSDSTP